MSCTCANCFIQGMSLKFHICHVNRLDQHILGNTCTLMMVIKGLFICLVYNDKNVCLYACVCCCMCANCFIQGMALKFDICHVNRFSFQTSNGKFNKIVTFTFQCMRNELTPTKCDPCISWWHHEMETFFALLAICAGNSSVPGEFPAQRPVTRSFDVFFDLRLNKRLSKQSWGWWFEMPSGPLWRHRKVIDWTDRRFIKRENACTSFGGE